MASTRFSDRGRLPRLAVEVLERRDCPAVSATFMGGVLTVVGDAGPNQVNVIELGGGAVEVTGDGQPFSFTGVESIVIKTFDGDDRVEYGARSPAAASEMGNRQLDIDVGSGDDVKVLRISSTGVGSAGFPVSFQARLSLGTGHDILRAEIEHGDDVSLDVFAADGGDDCGIRVLQRLNGTIVHVPVAIHVSFDLAGGGNRVSLATGPAEEVDVHAKTTDRAGTTHSGPGDRFSLAFGGADRRGPFFNFNPGRLRVVTDLGDANDRVTMEAGGFGDVSTEIDTGGGNDRVNTYSWSYLLRRPRPSDAAPAHVTFDARLGDGDDRLTSRFAGYDTADLNLDLGTGDDRGKIVLWVRESPQVPTVGVIAQLGAGDDLFRVLAHGYDEARASLDTGPAGDTNDQVLATFVRPDEAGVRRRQLVTLHSMDLGRIGVLGVGYPVGDVDLQGHECLVFFSGGLP